MYLTFYAFNFPVLRPCRLAVGKEITVARMLGAGKAMIQEISTFNILDDIF